MRDGLRSRSKVLVEANSGEQGSDSAEDNATNLIGSELAKAKCNSDSKQNGEIGGGDGLNYEDSGAENDTVALESTNAKRKRTRSDERGIESEGDCLKKRESKELNECGNSRAGGRVLRSMSAVKYDPGNDSIGRRTRGRCRSGDKSIHAVKFDNKGDAQRKNIDGNCTGRRTRGRSRTEDEDRDVVKLESKDGLEGNNIDGDCIGKRTRARGGLEDKNADAVMSYDEEAVQKTKEKSGAEDKILNVVTSESKEVIERNSIDGDCVGKRTRSRGGLESKNVDAIMSEDEEAVQKTGGRGLPEHPVVDVVLSDSKEDVQKKNVDSSSPGKSTKERDAPEGKSVDEVICENKEDDQKKNVDDDFFGERIGGRVGSEDNNISLVVEEANGSNKEQHNLPQTTEKNENLVKEMPSDSLGSPVLQEKAEVKKEQIDQSADEENNQLTDQVSKKLKRKRGRPFKTQQSNESAKEFNDVLKGQGNQFVTQEVNRSHTKGRKKLKRKRGRPPKAKEGNDLTTIPDSNQTKKAKMKVLKPRCGRPPKACDDRMLEEKRGNLKAESGKPFTVNKDKSIGKGDKKLLKVEKMKCPKVDIRGGNEINKDGDTALKKSEKQVVRDKIVELLLGAGWEIQYRPRFGRLYNDAVYVNPEGRTHWSVTLAYRVLKQSFENDTADSKAFKPGFKFVPIPEEELNLLARVFSKERSDKNKKKMKRKKDGDEFVSGVTKKKKLILQKGKHGPAVGRGHKILTGKSKLKSGHHNNRSGGMKGLRTAVAVRGGKGVEMNGRKRCGLMVRSSQDGSNSDRDKYFLYNGKRTVLTWMIDLGTVALDGRVEYLESRNMPAQRTGKVKTDGIQCDCCSKTFAIAEFEAHAGGRSGQPFENMFLETGASLLQCQLDSWHKQDEPAKKGFHLIDTGGEDPNDDTCGICGDGGDLICCDGCPSTFHKSCLEITKFPSGPWHCIYCICKFCGKVGEEESQESDDVALPHGLSTCCLCEEKYHQSCVRVKDGINEGPSNTSFCGEKCQKLYEGLQMLLGVKHELEEGFSWTFVRRYDVGSDISLSGMPRKVECNSTVAVALHIMDECFMPMVDHRSGVNLIRNIVYNFGSNFNRLNYTGFFTAVLERGDEMVAVASIRIHGNKLAEMPFIGTRYMYRRQGMCRRLLTGIETALCSLNVEKLVIPAISELRGTWSSVFGFKPFEGSSKKILKNLNMMVFPGVDMLQKSLFDHQITEEVVQAHPKEGSISAERVELSLEEKTNESDSRCRGGVDLKDSKETGTLSNGASKVSTLKSDTLADGCLSDVSDVTFQKANSVQCCHQPAMVSDIPDGKNARTTSCLDTSTGANQKLGNEKKHSFDLTCSKIDVPCSSNISTETAEAESVSIASFGSLNDALDAFDLDANKSKCQGLLSRFLGNLGWRNKTSKNAGQSNALSTDKILPTESTSQPCQGQLNQNQVSEADDKLSEEIPHASVDSLRPSCETKGDSNVAFCNSKTDKSTTPEAHQITIEPPAGSSDALLNKQSTSTSESKKCDGDKKEATLVTSDNPAIVTEVESSDVNVVHDSKDVSTAAQNVALSPVADEANPDMKLTELTGTDSDIDRALVAQCNCESSCSLSSHTAAGLNCASGSSNSHMLLR